MEILCPSGPVSSGFRWMGLLPAMLMGAGLFFDGEGPPWARGRNRLSGTGAHVGDRRADALQRGGVKAEIVSALALLSAAPW